MSSHAGFPLIAFALAASSLLVAPAAHAERAVTHDETADAVSITYTQVDDGSEEEVIAPAPEHTSVDITRTVVQHRTDRVRLTVTLRDLVLNRRTLHLTAFRIVTPRAGYWVHVENLMQRKVTATLSRGARELECSGLRWSRDEDTDKVVVSVPTSCVDSPRWVQVGVGAVEVDADAMTPESEQMLTFVDDGHRAGSVAENSIAKGPRVHRG